MLWYITCVMLYNMKYVVLYNICHVYNIKYVMLYNICHITCLMLRFITYVIYYVI